MVKLDGVYKYFKGDYYIVKELAKHTETGESLVIYTNLSTAETYARPLDMFVGKVDKEKYPEIEQEYRFQSVESNLLERGVFV